MVQPTRPQSTLFVDTPTTKADIIELNTGGFLFQGRHTLDLTVSLQEYHALLRHSVLCACLLCNRSCLTVRLDMVAFVLGASAKGLKDGSSNLSTGYCVVW